MTRTNKFSALMALVIAAAGCGLANAQVVWQDASTNSASASAASDWQQRVLKKPQSQWRSADNAAVAEGQAVQQAVVSEQPTKKQPATAGKAVRRTSYDSNVFSAASVPNENTTAGRRRVARVSNEEVVNSGSTQFEPMATEGAFAQKSVRRGCSSCNGGASAALFGDEPAGSCGDCGECGECEACDEPCDGWELFDGRCRPVLQGLSVFVGGDAFKNAVDGGHNGNFGVNEGLNLARPLGDPWGCGYQLGVNFVQSDFSGTPRVTLNDYQIHSAYRKQYFATAGIFQRAKPCGGFQWGVAYDYMHDVYYTTYDLQQIRSETSFAFGCYEVGYYGVYGIGTAKDRVIDGKLDPTDMFALFLRKKFENGGDGRIWGGATGYGDGLLGADLWVPLGKSFALENRISYMIPKQGHNETGQGRESWGFVIQLVWYPGQSAVCQQSNPYRPLFNVADNSLFMVDRLEGK